MGSANIIAFFAVLTGACAIGIAILLLRREFSPKKKATTKYLYTPINHDQYRKIIK